MFSLLTATMNGDPFADMKGAAKTPSLSPFPVKAENQPRASRRRPAKNLNTRTQAPEAAKRRPEMTRTRNGRYPAAQKPDFSHGGSICHIVSCGNTPVKPAVYPPLRAPRPNLATAAREVLFSLNNSYKMSSHCRVRKKRPAPLKEAGLFLLFGCCFGGGIRFRRRPRGICRAGCA